MDWTQAADRESAASPRVVRGARRHGGETLVRGRRRERTERRFRPIGETRREEGAPARPAAPNGNPGGFPIPGRHAEPVPWSCAPRQEEPGRPIRAAAGRGNAGRGGIVDAPAVPAANPGRSRSDQRSEDPTYAEFGRRRAEAAPASSCRRDGRERISRG